MGFPNAMGMFPWHGCEAGIMDTLIAELRKRGKSDVEICELATMLALFAIEVERRAEMTQPVRAPIAKA